MSQLEDSNEPVRRDEAHERWLAMQSAYAEYTRASEVFENSRDMARDSADPGHCDLTLLDCRRDAFERYLEARMEYLECRYDDGYRRETAKVSWPARETGGLRISSWLAGPNWVIIPILVVGILSLTVFSFVREQTHVRDLGSARDQLQATLLDTREELQLLAKKLDAVESTGHSAVRQVEHAAQPVPAPHVGGRNPSGATRWRHTAEPIMKTASRGVAARGYFSLSRSSQFKRLGPIKVSLKSVDMQRNSVDLSIVSESGKVNVQHLRRNQPVLIRLSYHEQPMELVIDRITANGLSGHLTEFRG